MSMPDFPAENLKISCEQALNMLLGSIAMEELALSHIMNAEGEKLQYILGTLPGAPCSCVTPKEVLQVNRSVSDLLEKVSYNQLLLKGKLQQVLEAREQCCPSPREPEGGCTCPCAGVDVWTTEKCGTWFSGCPLLWKKGCERCESSFCRDHSAHCIHLCPPKSYFVCVSFCVQTSNPCLVRIALQGGGTCSGKTPFRIESFLPEGNKEAYLSGSTLFPAGKESTCLPIQIVLEHPNSLFLKQAKLTILTVS